MSTMVYTARVTYRGPDGLNITAKAQDPIGRTFAPSWGILRPMLAARKRNGEHTAEEWAAYETAYTGEMRRSYASHPAVWRSVLSRESVTLLCFCTHATQCHRFVCARIFEKLGATLCGERKVA